MKRAVLYGLCIGTAFFLPLGGKQVGDARNTPASSISRVTIDGRSFASEASPGNDAHFLRREMERLGVKATNGFEIDRQAVTDPPAFGGRLLGSPTRQPPPKPPPGLTAEHTIRMEGDGQSIELVFGRMDPLGSTVHSRLVAEGWMPALQEKEIRTPRVLQKIQGKEANVACLDEAERTFLLIRKVGR
jgi:hypothetical protein